MDVSTETNKAVIHIGYAKIKNWLEVVVKHEECQPCVPVAAATGGMLSKFHCLV